MHSGSQAKKREGMASDQTSQEFGWVFLQFLLIWKLLSPEKGQQGMGTGGDVGQNDPMGSHLQPIY